MEESQVFLVNRIPRDDDPADWVTVSAGCVVDTATTVAVTFRGLGHGGTKIIK